MPVFIVATICAAVILPAYVGPKKWRDAYNEWLGA